MILAGITAQFEFNWFFRTECGKMKFYFSSHKSVINAESIRVRVAAVTVNTAFYVHPDGPVACFFFQLFNGYVTSTVHCNPVYDCNCLDMRHHRL